MKIAYDEETDSMYIQLGEDAVVDSDEVAKNVVLDFNQKGDVVGIDIQHASQITNVAKFAFEQYANKQAA